MQWLMRMNAERSRLPFLATRFGKWWGADPRRREQTDIDVVLADPQTKRILLGECTWRNSFNETEAVEALLGREGLIPGYDDGGSRPISTSYLPTRRRNVSCWENARGATRSTRPKPWRRFSVGRGSSLGTTIRGSWFSASIRCPTPPAIGMPVRWTSSPPGNCIGADAKTCAVVESLTVAGSVGEGVLDRLVLGLGDRQDRAVALLDPAEVDVVGRRPIQRVA